MKAGDQEKNVECLLRATRPAVEIPPGLEGRILHAIAREQRSAPGVRRWLPWLLLPAAAALALLLARPAAPLPSPPPQARPSPVAKATPPPGKRNTIALLEHMNPLAQESRALEREASKAGRFLLECLPSLSTAEP